MQRILLLCAFFSGLASVSAQPTQEKAKRAPSAVGDHFDPVSTAWNGCSRWMQIAMKEGLTVTAPKIWDWRKAKVQDPIIILSPQNEDLKTKPLLDFIKAGGRVLLTDDFGAGDNLWEAMGLWGRRTPLVPDPRSPPLDIHYTVTHSTQGADFLLRQASFVFLNVPQWFFLNEKSAVEPLLFARAYRSNQPDKAMEGYVLVRARRGDGAMVILTDPSAMINQMIAYGDNRRLARNLVRFLARPSQARRLVVLWGNFSWKGEFVNSPPTLARTSLYIWDIVTEFNSLITSFPALFRAFPPYWEKQSRIATARYKIAKAHSQFLTRSHLKNIANRWWILSVFLLGWLVIGVRWMPWFREQPYQPEREREGHIIPHRLTEQVDAHQSHQEDFLWPLIVLKEEFASFLRDHLEPIRPRDSAVSENRARSIPEQLSANFKSQHLMNLSPSLVAWEQLTQHHRNHGAPHMSEPQWKLIHELLTQVPDRRDWERMMNQATPIKARQLKVYHQASLYCLRQLGLLDEFYAPLSSHNNKPKSL